MFGGTISYTYDELDNLQTVAKPNEPVLRYCYDGSKRLAFIRENTPNCTSGASRASLGWDAQGNGLWKNELDFVFSFDNRLRSVTGVESYRYDGHGRRILSNGAGGNLFSLYSNDGVIRHITNGRAKQRVEQYVYLAGSLVAVRETPLAGGASVVKYQHTDALGTPVVVTDASRNIIEQNRYEPYGKLLDKAPDDNPGFTGHVEDAATGLTYMQQRYYDPLIGSFLGPDPESAGIEPEKSFHRYWYANANPYRFNDPDGRRAELSGMMPLTERGFDITAKDAFLNDGLRLANQGRWERWIAEHPLPERFASCVSEGQWDWGKLGRSGGSGQSSTGTASSSAQVANAAANAAFGQTPRGGISTAQHASTWQHRAALEVGKAAQSMATGNKMGSIQAAASKAGRFVGRAAIVTTIWEGAWDIGTIGYCAVE